MTSKLTQSLITLKKQTFITEKTANLVKLENSKTPKFYTSPKIHKQENPGRPVFN